MLTKEQKEKWLEALKSGKYKQTGHKLKDNVGGHCCLDVLAITAGIETDEYDCFIGGKEEGYKPFGELLGESTRIDLANENDSSFDNGVRDYSAVIPLIEKLPTA